MNFRYIQKLLFIMNTSLNFQIIMRKFIKLLFEIIIKRNNYLNEIFNKDSIIIEYIDDFLYLFYNFRE